MSLTNFTSVTEAKDVYLQCNQLYDISMEIVYCRSDMDQTLGLGEAQLR